MSLDEIVEELGNPGHQGNFLESDDAQDAVDPTVSWRVLPIHPKVAVLFLRGMTVIKAAKLAQEVDFLRIACTTTGVVSRTEVKWELINQHQSDQVFDWCQGLQNQYFRSSEGTAVQMPIESMPVAMAALPPARDNNTVEFAAMVAAAFDASNSNAGGTGKKSKFSPSFVEEYAEIAGIEDPDPCDSSIMMAFYRVWKNTKVIERRLKNTSKNVSGRSLRETLKRRGKWSRF